MRLLPDGSIFRRSHLTNDRSTQSLSLVTETQVNGSEDAKHPSVTSEASDLSSFFPMTLHVGVSEANPDIDNAHTLDNTHTLDNASRTRAFKNLSNTHARAGAREAKVIPLFNVDSLSCVGCECEPPTATRVAVDTMQRIEAAESIAAWAKTAKRDKPTREELAAAYDVELERMLATDDWSKAQPIHLVRLYAMLHREVYKVEAAELRDPGTLRYGCFQAKKLIAEEAGGSLVTVVDFMRWSWEREEWKAIYRERHNCQHAKRLTLRAQFSFALWTDYQLNSRKAQ